MRTAAPSESPAFTNCTPFASGATAKFPSGPHTDRKFTDDDKGSFETAKCVSEHAGQTFVLSRVSRGGADRLEDERFIQRLIDGASKTDKTRRFDAFGLHAVEMRGRSEQNAPFVRRMYVVGDGAVIAEVASKSQTLDDAAARRFLDSVVLKTSWTVRAFPQVAMSVALPNHGIELSAKDLHEDKALVANAVFVGGLASRIFSIYVYSIAGHPQGLSIEGRLQLLPYLVKDLGPEAKRSPIDFNGLHGVETSTRGDKTYRRTRFFATSHTVIALIASATEAAALNDQDTLRFFESLQWYDDG